MPDPGQGTNVNCLSHCARNWSEAPILEKASRTTWDIVLSPAGVGGEIVNQVDSVYSLLASEKAQISAKAEEKDAVESVAAGLKPKASTKLKTGEKTSLTETAADERKLPRVLSQEGKGGSHHLPKVKSLSSLKGAGGGTRSAGGGQHLLHGKVQSVGKSGPNSGIAFLNSGKSKVPSSGTSKALSNPKQGSDQPKRATEGDEHKETTSRALAEDLPGKDQRDDKTKKGQESLDLEPEGTETKASEAAAAGEQPSILEATNVLSSVGIPAPLLELPALPGPRWVGDTLSLRILASALGIQPDYNALVQSVPPPVRKEARNVEEGSRSNAEAQGSKHDIPDSTNPAPGVPQTGLSKQTAEDSQRSSAQQSEIRKRNRSGGWDVPPPSMSLQDEAMPGPDMGDTSRLHGIRPDSFHASKRQAVSHPPQLSPTLRQWNDFGGSFVGPGMRYGSQAAYRQHAGYSQGVAEPWRAEQNQDGGSSQMDGRSRSRNSNWNKSTEGRQAHGSAVDLTRRGSRGSGEFPDSPSLHETVSGRATSHRDDRRGERDAGTLTRRSSGSSPKSTSSRALPSFRSPREGDQDRERDRDRDRDGSGRQREWRPSGGDSLRVGSEEPSPRDRPRSTREEGEAKEKLTQTLARRS